MAIGMRQAGVAGGPKGSADSHYPMAAGDGERCGRLCDVLYLAPGQTYFVCRRCLDLTYRSCRTPHAGTSSGEEPCAEGL